MGESLTERQLELCEKIANLLREYADACGPVTIEIEETIDAAGMAALPHATDTALAEWVLVMSWLDLDTGNYFTTKVSQPRMPSHHQYGLLADWLEELK